jgi:hypothetical protein
MRACTLSRGNRRPCQLESLACAVARRRREGDAKVRLDADPVEAVHEPEPDRLREHRLRVLFPARTRSCTATGTCRRTTSRRMKSRSSRCCHDVVQWEVCWRLIAMPLVLASPSLARSPTLDLGLVVWYGCLVLAQECFVAASVG